ncbi:MAG: methylated-DNA--[protein]-cysteine S-methyltransferase [Alphaproteobacteria bacterium]|nr:methylated-DNA--[protein]-cysteine S-methyltransferase [Alphaproteobacteria bacterium]
MVKISTTQFQGFEFSVVYDTKLIFSGFFSPNDLPKEVMSLNPSRDSETLAKEICARYEESDCHQLPLPMALYGTEFQMKVWKSINEISKGQTLTYTKLAEAVQRPAAVRAAGTACGKNPLTLIIPCHRVLGLASFGGYRWGLNIKQTLLTHEAIDSKSVAQR